MIHEVFISYSSKDKQIADAMCAKLEENGVGCWIAPRDIIPGAIFHDALMNAIDKARIMVMIYSSNSLNSPQVIRELTRAVEKNVVIIPFRIEDIPPSGSMEWLISVPHWLDALTLPLEQHLQSLSKNIKFILETDIGEEKKVEYIEPDERIKAGAIDAILLLFAILFTVPILYNFFEFFITNYIGDAALIILVILIITILYSSLLESSKYQSTIGKREFRCIVTDMEGNRITFRTGAIRAILKVFSIGFFGIGIVMMYRSDKCQGLHDVYAKTIVIRNRKFGSNHKR
jgi:uncharacterized RDD family membrane protein YckC